MANLQWPSDICPLSFSLLNDANVRGSTNVNEADGDLNEDRWLASLNVDAVQGRQAAVLETLTNRLAGGFNTVELYHFARPLPRGTARASKGLLTAATAGASSVTLIVEPFATLLAGDMLKAGNLLLQVAERCYADSNGVITVYLVNRLRNALTGFRRASPATYIDSFNLVKTAAVDVPRFSSGNSSSSVAGSSTYPVTVDGYPITVDGQPVTVDGYSASTGSYPVTVDGYPLTVTTDGVVALGTPTQNLYGGPDPLSTAAESGSYGSPITWLKETTVNHLGLVPGQQISVSARVWQDVAAKLAGGDNGGTAVVYLFTSRANGDWTWSLTLTSAETTPTYVSATGNLPADPLDMAAMGLGVWKQGTNAALRAGTVYAEQIQVERGTVTAYAPRDGLLLEASAENTVHDSDAPIPSIFMGGSASKITTDLPTGLSGYCTEIVIPAGGEVARFGGLAGGNGSSAYVGSLWMRTVTTPFDVLLDVNDGTSPWGTVGTTWKRYWATRGPSGTPYRFLDLNIDAGAADRRLQVWGVQVETGSTPTSYISTPVGAPATRAADVILPVNLNKPSVPFRVLTSSPNAYGLTALSAKSFTFEEDVA